MYYARHHGIGQADEIPVDAVEIKTGDQYRDALDRIAAGEHVTVVDGAVAYYTSPVQLIDADGFHTGEAQEYTPGDALIMGAPGPGLLRPKWDGAQWIEGATQQELDDHAAQELADAKEAGRVSIDSHAGATRDRFVSPGELIDQEYKRAHELATAWLADTSQPVPQCVQSWADAKVWTAQQAAEDIRDTGDLWFLLLDSIRDTRLLRKAEVDQAATVAEVDQIVADAKAELDAL